MGSVRVASSPGFRHGRRRDIHVQPLEQQHQRHLLPSAQLERRLRHSVRGQRAVRSRLLFVVCLLPSSHGLMVSSPHRLMALFLFLIFVLPGTSISCPPPSSAIAPSLRFEGRRLRTKRRHALSTSPTPRWVLCTRAAPGRVPRCRRANRPSTRAQRATSSTFLKRQAHVVSSSKMAAFASVWFALISANSSGTFFLAEL